MRVVREENTTFASVKRTWGDSWWRGAVALLFAAAGVLFYALPYVGVLSYEEQYQLFLWTKDYFLSRLSTPGGMADYLSEALTQLNYIPIVGAIVKALLLLALQQLTWAVARKHAADTTTWYALTFVPPLLLWFYMADPNVLMSFSLALIAALAVVYSYRLPQRNSLCLATIALLVPAFYWLFGTAVYIVAAAIMIEALRQKRWWLSLVAPLYTLAIVYAMSYVLPFPLNRLLVGLHYYRYPVGVPAMQWWVMTATLVAPYLAALLPKRRWQGVGIVVSLAVIAGGGKMILTTHDDLTHTMLDYDYLVRAEKWDAIIAKAQRKPASTPMDVAIVNLALCQRGQLLERLFSFYQNGGEGLFPPFSRNILSPITTAEVYFRLGFVNDSERCFFEAQQAIPDYQHSGRLMKRLVQCEVANGEYAVAKRYLHVLMNTTFYRAWAKKTLALLADENAINTHPTYAYLRQNREQKSDYLFSEREMDQMVGLLLRNNEKNRMAYEYLVAYELLERDLPHFNEYYPLGKNVGYKRIPTVLQEVLIGQWLLSHSDLNGMPYSVDAAIVKNTVAFLRMYTAQNDDPRLAQEPYKHNAWHYLFHL